jgi:hypothetical protein
MTAPLKTRFEQLEQFTAVGPRPTCLLSIEFGAPILAHVRKLRVERLPKGAYVGMARAAAFRPCLIISYGKRAILKYCAQTAFPQVLQTVKTTDHNGNKQHSGQQGRCYQMMLLPDYM